MLIFLEIPNFESEEYQQNIKKLFEKLSKEFDASTVFEFKLQFTMADLKCRFLRELLDQILTTNLEEIFNQNSSKKILDLK